MKIIITGTTGMVGEGVLLTCLEHPDTTEVLIVNRKSLGMNHSKLKECIIPDFLKLDEFRDQLTGYDACFFCAGISSIGMKEPEFTRITYDVTIHFATTVSNLNTGMVFTYVSGAHTDSSEKGKVMWARVKGKTENALMKLSFKKAYNFRPGLMKPVPGQKNIKPLFKFITNLYPVFKFLFPKRVCTLGEVGSAMINCVRKGYSKQILEVEDIKQVAKAE